MLVCFFNGFGTGDGRSNAKALSCSFCGTECEPLCAEIDLEAKGMHSHTQDLIGMYFPI